MKRKGWYLIAYDIANPSRLANVYKYLKNRGVHAQKSLFFIYGTETYINMLLDSISVLMKPSEDDLRAYPIINPSKVWTNCSNPLVSFPCIYV